MRSSGESVPLSRETAGRPRPDVDPSGDAARVSGEAARGAGAAGVSAEVAPPPVETVLETPRIVPWKTSSWLPSAVDNRIYSLVVLRHRWKDNLGRSSIDQDSMPTSPKEIAAYLPRLLAVGFLAPFAGQWFEEGAFKSTTIMRRTVGVEMVLAYIAYVGLALGVWRWRARLELWFVLAYGSIPTLIWAYIVPNIGSLHRARFGFLMVLVALGFAAILSSPRIDWIARVRR